jgi:hypothetical protein
MSAFLECLLSKANRLTRGFECLPRSREGLISMRPERRDGLVFEMSIVGYEFPNSRKLNAVPIGST